MSYIKIQHFAKSSSGLTDIYEVTVNNSTSLFTILGRIAWKGTWRKYCFYPSDDTVFDAQCLQKILLFCTDKTLEHKTKDIMESL